MLGSRAWFALMRRNFVYRRRHWISSIFELLLPFCFIALMIWIKNTADDSSSFDQETINATFPDSSITPLSFTDYVTALRAERVCLGPDSISGYQPFGGENWMVPLVKCDSRKCPGSDFTVSALPYCEFSIIAVAGINGGETRAGVFKGWVETNYPAIVDPDEMPFDFPLIQVFDDPQAMDQYVTSDSYGETGTPKIAMGIVFDGGADGEWNYWLRQNSTNFNSPEEEARPATLTTPDTGIWTDSFARNDNDVCFPEGGTPYLGEFYSSCTGQYIYNGVLTFQRLVDDFILESAGAGRAGYRVAEGGVNYVPYPTRAYVESGFYAAVGTFAPILTILGLLYPVSCMISYITREKEFRQKELMKMMSVTESDIGWAWFMTYMSFHFFTGTFAAWASDILFEKSEFFWLWVFWMLAFVAMVVFCMAMASLTSKTVRAVLIGLLVFLTGMILALAIDYEDRDVSTIQLISLHPVAAFSYGLSQIGKLEDNEIGLKASTLDVSESRSGYTFQDTLGALILDCILWGVVSWFLNRVITPDYGQALPVWFPFTKQYWCPSYTHLPVGKTTVEDEVAKLQIPYEPVGESQKRQASEEKSIEIHDLRKTFGEQNAVDGLNLSIYSGEITALLGHNGAGKTTTINMLTGAMAPSDGYATVAGRDIRTDMTGIRQDIGICLQHDCLFPNLTVREHIQFFSRLKGLYKQVSKMEAEAQIDQAIRDVALFDKRNTLSKNLSGGMKRKLSLAMAFCGGSKIVLLDEPTSGMDPFSRRFTWNVIRNYRQDRVIILTTHFMDEADILGDRIAIMAEGQLRCAGTSLFLKKHYGVGYQLTIEKGRSHEGNEKSDQIKNVERASEAETEAETASTDSKDPPAHFHGNDHEYHAVIKELVESAVPEASLLLDVGTEVRYRIPLGAASKFPAMFEGLDREADKGTIASYGVSVTTLDEVFLLVARGDHADGEKKHLRSSRRIDGTDVEASGAADDQSMKSRMDLERSGLFFRHVGAMFKKRAASFRRDKRAWTCTTILPTIFVLGGLLLFKFASPQRNLDPVTLDMSAFNTDVSSGPINPFPYNSRIVNPYVCQPGDCAYTNGVVSPDTNEKYSFCGSLVHLQYQSDLQGIEIDSDDRLTCSISESEYIINTLDGFEGISPEETDVNKITSSSKELHATSNNTYEASQYGSIWFTRDVSSEIGAGTGNKTANATAGKVGSPFATEIASLCAKRAPLLNYTSLDDCEKYQGIGFVVQYNFTGLHTAPLFQSLADQALVRYATNDPDFVIKTTIAPLPITKVEKGFGQAEDAFLAWFLVVLSFPFIAGSFAVFVVMERESKAKHLQTVAGVEPTAYWISTFLWDCINYQLPCWLTIALFFIFDVDILTTSERDSFSGIVALLFFFGPAAAGFAYCFSFFFKSPSLCNVLLIVGGFIIGMGGGITVFILDLLGGDPSNPNDKLKNAATITSWVLRFFPFFNLGKGVFFVLNIEAISFLQLEPNISAWDGGVLLYEVIFLAVEGFAYTGLAILLDVFAPNINIVIGRQRGPDITTALPEDDDVIVEQDRVIEGSANDDLIVISQMSKIYSNGKIAVNGMSLGIPAGECFGLLGINGAGKTTTMGVLTAEFPPTTGDATLAGFSVTKEPKMIRRRIGYCPQFDAHFANLSGREHVELYASIKGVPRRFVKEAASKTLKQVGLNDRDSDKLCSNYSGGMKRRLSLACAIIGQPQIVFLDECSTGVDPVARREIWQLVSDMVAGGEDVPPEERTSVVLTTHSMEECEALCPRIGIMANGRLRCLGSAQHLKNKFGQGYQVELKAELPNRNDEDFITIASTFAATRAGTQVDESAGDLPEIFFSYEGVRTALAAVDDESNSLASMVAANNPIGYNMYKDSTSPVGVSLLALATWATTELRMKKIAEFLEQRFPQHILRERQDTKVRYEVSNEGVRLSEIFSSIEKKKENLFLADYGVSQTSLEQVFNMHAAEAERLKEGRDER